MQDQPKREKFEYKYPKKPKRDSDKDSSYRRTKVICNLKYLFPIYDKCSLIY